MKAGGGDAIKVFIRVRPLNDKQKGSKSCVSFDGASVQMNDHEPDHRFSYDHVFGMESTQHQVYENVGHEVVQSAFQGFNGTVFAYGQTSSGKTHTCIGPDYNDAQLQGILPRMVNHIFQKIQKAPNYLEFRIKVSMVEIYMEKIKDLLDHSKTDLKIRQRAGKGIYIQDVTEQYVASSPETIQLLKRGIASRSVGQTNMNDTSSRSHMAFIITLYQNNLKDASAKSGKIILVDLAGSQKVSKTGAEGKLLDQAKQINKSLSALGNVINSLTDQKLSHIPYRDSKLTRLLQQSLGGNSKTNLIINVSPSELNQPQTLSSLRFGFRAKQIKNKPKINREYTVAELLLLLQKAEKRIQQLQQMIKQLTHGNSMNNSMSKERKKNMKKINQVYVQNLLDSDNPILESQDQAAKKTITQGDQQDEQYPQRKSLNRSKLKLQFQSCQQQSQSEVQDLKELSSSKSSPSKIQNLNKQLQEEKDMLGEEIQLLNVQKVELIRQLDIVQQKYEIVTKQKKTSNTKMAYLQKQNEKLLQRVVEQTSSNQQNRLKIQQLEDKINQYEQKILNIAAIQQKDKSMSNVFGSTSQLSAQTKRMVDIVMKNKNKEMISQEQIQDNIDKKIQIQQSKDEEIKELKKNNKVLSEQIALFKNLQDAKQAFIQERLKFGSQKQRLYKDLADRIQKVCELQEAMDDKNQQIKYFEELIKMSESQKSRKISLLQQHVNQISENYYVLKGQQSSWQKDNQKITKKIQSKNKRIVTLEKQVMTLREQVENLKLQVQQLQNNPQQNLLFDMDMDISEVEGQQNKNGGNIIKVLRPASLRVTQNIFQPEH